MAAHTGKQPIIFSFGTGFLDGGCKKRLTEQGNIRIIFYVADIQPRIYNLKALFYNRRDDRAVEGARLESVCTGNRTEGSNPSLSAIRKQVPHSGFFLLTYRYQEKVFLYDCSGRSCAMEACEPCQVRKEAALSGSLHAPRGCLPCGLTGKPAESSP